jgi:hypothetical protein
MVGGRGYPNPPRGLIGLGRQAMLSLAVVLLLALAGEASGCGSGGSTSEAETPRNPLAGYPKGPTRQFIAPGGDNAVQEFGREAAAAERKQVSKTVEAWLRARVIDEWARACSYMYKKLTAYAIVTGSEVSGKHLTTCAEGLAALTRNAETPRDPIKGGVASLRIKAGQGYAQYHGKEGRDWILSVQREDGTWKIANLYPLERFK